MKADTKLKAGDMAITEGYYAPNDSGSGEYIIVSTQDTSKHQELLNNGFYATLLLNETINPKQLGAKADGTTNDSTFIQKAINLASNKYKVICNGNHAISSTLVFGTSLCNFESCGDIILLNDIDAFKIDNISGANININHITSTEIGNGIHILADTNIVASLNLNVGSILNTKKGIILESNNTKGIQYNKISWNSMYTTEHGILLKCGNNGNPWINENQFYGGRISSAIGIETQKGTEQTDRFNGNKFFNFGLEGISSIGIKLNYTQANIFENFRATESFTGSHWFSFNNCREDVIKWESIRPGLTRTLFEFIGTNEFIHFIGYMRAGGVIISEEAVYQKNGWFDIKPLYQPQLSLYNNDRTIDSCYNGLFIRAGADDNKTLTVTLPDIMSNDSSVSGSLSPYLTYFFIGVLYKGGTINFVDGENNIIIGDSELTAHKLYMCIRYTTASENAYQLVVLDTNYF